VLEYDVILKRGTGLYDTPGDLHAGEIETSRILTVRPDLVRMDLAPEESGRESARPLLVRDVRRYWPSSVAGAPRRATAEKGERLGAVVGEYLADLVRKMEQTPPH
jgi:creatinine amidohydrolase